MTKKPTYRQLERDLKQLQGKHEADLKAFRESIEVILTNSISDKAHAMVGQDILEEVIRQASYKELTIFEMKQWFEQKWKKRQEFDGEAVEQAEWLGLPEIESVLQNTYLECEEELTTMMINVYQEYVKTYGNKRND